MHAGILFLVHVLKSFLSVVLSGTTGSNAVCGLSMQAKSASIPYLEKPPALDGSMEGDVGFDPLWVSSALPDAGR